MTNTEIKIRELKNELDYLTKKVLTEELIKSIEKKAEIRDNAEKSEFESLMDNLVDLKIRIDDLQDRIINIHMIADSLRENGFKVPSGFPSSRIRLDSHKHDNFIELNIINTKGYLLVTSYDNEDDDFCIRNSVFDAINRGVWNRGLTVKEKIGYLNLDIDLMSEFLKDFDVFEHDFYEYAQNI